MSRTVENPPAAVQVDVMDAPRAKEPGFAVEHINSLDQVRQRLYRVLTHEHRRPRHAKPRLNPRLRTGRG